MTAPLELHGVSVAYEGSDRPALSQVDLLVDEGEFVLVAGETGSGKSTLLRAACGLVPHFTGGTLAGRVVVAGRDTATHRPRDLADAIGYVGQNPAATFVADIVEDELAYTMENLGIAPDVMRRRVEETLDLLGIAELRDRPLATLSGGQQQRVAIAAVLTAAPRLLVLDEPTSALDPVAAEDVLSSLARLVHDVAMTIVVAEHRLERIVHLVDRVVLLDRSGRIETGPPAEVFRTATIGPPVVRLGRALGWDPLPLSVRDARRSAADLRTRLAAAAVPTHRAAGNAVASLRRVTFRYGGVTALDGVDLDIASGQIAAVMGRNGAGKSTLLHLLAGAIEARTGSVTVGGADPRRLSGRELIARVGLVPQDPGLLLYADRVDTECALADREGGLASGTTVEVLRELAPDLPADRHPRDLSEGQRLLLALAVVLAHRPPLVLLDEPTRGLDPHAKERLAAALGHLADDGAAVVLATHDVELAAALVDRVIVLADGDVITDGDARSVLCHSPTLAPQVARILAPLELLTVEDVAAALHEVG